MELSMTEFSCDSCGYVYDPERSDCKNIQFKNRPEDWQCPACNAPKSRFTKLGPEYKAMKKKFKEKGVKKKG
jgi:rubredoxin